MRIVANNDPATDDDLAHIFNHHFMRQIRVQFRGAERWRGFIGKMSLYRDNLILTKDIRNLTNAAKCEFQVKHSDAVWYKYYTHWYINEVSLKQYGNFEKALTYTSTLLENATRTPPTPPGLVEYTGTDDDGEPIYTLVRDQDGRPVTEPEGRADEYIKRWSSPFTQSIAPGVTDNNYLDIQLYGAEILADRILLSDGTFAYRLPSDVESWNYDEIDGSKIHQLRSVPSDSDYADVEHGDGATVSEEIGRIVDVVRYNSQLYGHEPLLYKIGIADNPRGTIAGVDKPTGAMTRLRELAQLRDFDDNVYRLRIEPDGGVLYEKYPTTPKYYSYPPPKGIQTSSEETPTWDARPEPIKIIGADWIDDLPETWLGDGSIVPVDRVTMRDGAEVAEFGTLEYTEDQFMATFKANQRRIRNARKKKNG
jgi:hypothetical protein